LFGAGEREKAMGASKKKKKVLSGDSITVPDDRMIQKKVEKAKTLLLQGNELLKECGCDEDMEREAWDSLPEGLAILEKLLFRGFDVTAKKRFEYAYENAAFFTLRSSLCRDEEEPGEEEEDEFEEENENE
jgi:hypothetical protein